MEDQQEHAMHHFGSTVAKQGQGIVSSSLSPSNRGGPNSNLVASSSNDCGRERLERHRSGVAGRVVVPDKWSQEEMLKDWLDMGSFDALLAPKGFDLARAALVAERSQAKEAMENTNKAYIGMHCSATRCS